MSRYMEAINLLHVIRRSENVSELVRQKIEQVLAMYESPGEQAIREGDEMVEECLRMNF